MRKTVNYLNLIQIANLKPSHIITTNKKNICIKYEIHPSSQIKKLTKKKRINSKSQSGRKKTDKSNKKKVIFIYKTN